MSGEETDLVMQLVKEKLKNPYAARELLTALKSPGARFFSMSNGITNQIFRTVQDTDRALESMSRVSVLRPGNLQARHDVEEKLGALMQGLVDVTAAIAIYSKTPDHLIQDRNVKDAIRHAKPKGKSEKGPAEEETKAA